MAKRNAQGGGSIRQRKDGTWEARYTTGRDPGTGKQVQKSVYGKTQKEVRQKLALATVEIDDGTYIESSKLSIGAWLDIWLQEYVEPAVKPSTRHSYTRICGYYIKPQLGAIKLTALSTHAIQKFYNDLLKESDTKAGLSAKTVKGIHGVLHKALSQAIKLGYLRTNPTESCTLPRLTKKEIKPLDEGQIADFIKAIQNHEYETIYTLTLFTGMRQSEVLGLRWECVDFEKGVLTVNAQLLRDYNKGGGYFMSTVKNDKMRTISPAPYVMAMLQQQKQKQLEMRRHAADAWADTDFVFTNEIGQHLKHVTVYKNYKRIVTAMGLSTARFHDLRHSYAVAAIRSGDDIKTVQENLGHHTAAFTLDVYGHVTEQMKRESANRMELFIKGVKGM